MRTDYAKNLEEFFNHLKTAESIAEFLALTRVYFAPETSYYATGRAAAFYPPNAGEEHLTQTLTQAGWNINPIDGSRWWCSKGPADRGQPVAVEYQGGQLYIHTNPRI